MVVLGTPAMLHDIPPVTITFCDNTIPNARVVKNLGLTMDRNLNYQSHIDVMSKKCTGILIALSHARHVIPRAALKVIVESLVLSIVRYCLSIYGSCGDCQVHRVQKVLNFAARVVTGRRRYDHISDTFDDLGWLTAEQLVSYTTVSAVERIIVTGVPEYVQQTFGTRASQLHQHYTRGAQSRTLPLIRTESGRRRLCYRGVAALNRTGLEAGGQHFKSDLRNFIKSPAWLG